MTKHPGHAYHPMLSAKDSSLSRRNAHIAQKWLGENVRKLRMEMKIPQVQLAEFVGVSPTTINKLENQGSRILLVHAIVIADALGTTVGGLLDE